MMLDNKEAITYVGGGSITAAFLNACAKLFDTIYEFGQNLGSSIIRAIRGKSCN